MKIATNTDQLYPGLSTLAVKEIGGILIPLPTLRFELLAALKRGVCAKLGRTMLARNDDANKLGSTGITPNCSNSLCGERRRINKREMHLAYRDLLVIACKNYRVGSWPLDDDV